MWNIILLCMSSIACGDTDGESSMARRIDGYVCVRIIVI